MTVAATPSRISYVGNGVTTVFNYPYYFQSVNDLKVSLYDSVADTITPLVLNTDYTLGGTFTPGFGFENGTNVTVPGITLNVPAILPSTSKIVIYRDPAELQNLNLPDNTPYPPEPIESNFDAIILMMQRLYDWLTRAMTLPDGFIGTFNPQIPHDLPGTTNAGCTIITDPTGQFFIVGPQISGGGSGNSFSVTKTDVSSGSQPYVLPAAASNNGKTFVVLNPTFGSSNVINVGVTGGDLIMGQSSDTITAGQTKWYWSDGVSNWYIIN